MLRSTDRPACGGLVTRWRCWLTFVLLMIVIGQNAVGADPEKIADAPGRWTLERASAWSRTQPWLVGCNYMPSSAINQLEMFQADTFYPQLIDREFGLAQSLGFNSVRVFLHDLLWKHDRDGFLKRC